MQSKESIEKSVAFEATYFHRLENDFLSVATHCTDQLFDWLTIKELAALNGTCEKLRQLTADYFNRKYPMKCMKVGFYDTKDVLYWSKDKVEMQPFARNVRNLVVLPTTECLEFLDLYHTKNVVSLAFYDGQLLEYDAAHIARLLENVEILEIQYGSLSGELYETVLKYCRRIKQLVIKYGFSECEDGGRENQWLQAIYPTLEHFHWSESYVPEHLAQFFRQNPTIRSFNSGIYTTLSVCQFLLRTDLEIDELHFELILDLHEVREAEFEAMGVIRSSLDKLYERQQFKRLMLEFMFSSQLLDGAWSKLPYLTGAFIDFPYRPGATKALSTLIHLKLLILGINTILSAAKACILAKTLINLEEIYIQIGTVHAIRPFIRTAIKLRKIYVYRMAPETATATATSGGGNHMKYKSNFVDALNLERKKLNGACKTIVYLPDQVYVDMKCLANGRLNYDCIEIRRSESHVLKHPFVATKIRKNICELYEKF